MPTAQDVLGSPVQYLKGIGPRRAELLKGLGVETLADLLYYLPRDWEDRRETKDLSRAPEGKLVLKGVVESAELLPFRGRGLALFKARVVTAGGRVEANWFKRVTPRYDVFKGLRADIAPGKAVWLVGRPENTLLKVTDLQVDEYYAVDDPNAALHVDRIVPIYPLTEGLSGKFVREAVAQALKQAPYAQDAIPPLPARERKLMPVSEALKQIHFPDTMGRREEARRRLAYQEFFLIGMALALKRRQTKEAQKSFLYTVRKHLLTPFREHLGFEFTRSQKRVIHEIFTDMMGPNPMIRLLQGDVGAGKTVVAVSALLLAVENGYQGALMAPTEILAEQHYLTLQRLLRGLSVKVGLLTSKNKKAERRKLLDELRDGKIHILVGTHALLNEEVVIPRLSLVVIDEQHRFGVRQRGELRKKGGSPPDVLVMTATPIPRTLSLTLWGDLDISTLDELPPGRRPVETEVVGEEAAFAALLREVRAGHQAYVVCPVIDETARGETKAAATEVERMRKLFPQLRVELLHGQMPPARKDEIMEAFARGETDVLVATPVVEIGVDVPNATVMLIQHPERFGLASLHQLRGRVGRASLDSWCFLVGDPGGLSAERIDTLCRTHDGFEISERDLVLRGPGEVLGVEQHGPLSLRAGNLLRDLSLIKEAKTDSASVLESDPGLRRPEHQLLKTRLIDQYQRRWNWIDIS